MRLPNGNKNKLVLEKYFICHQLWTVISKQLRKVITAIISAYKNDRTEGEFFETHNENPLRKSLKNTTSGIKIGSIK
jgi:hypothetical protein